jgi:hypothetical protein
MVLDKTKYAPCRDPLTPSCEIPKVINKTTNQSKSQHVRKEKGRKNAVAHPSMFSPERADASLV